MFVFRRLFDRRTWLGTVHATTSLPVGLVGFVVAVVGLSASLGLMVILVGLFVAVATLWACSWLGRLERSRIEVLLGVHIDGPQPSRRPGSWWSRLGAALTDRSSWKQLVHAVLSLPVGLIACVVVTAVWAGGLALVTLPAYNWALPNGGARFGLFAVRGTLAAIPLAFVGLLMLVVIAPWIVAGVTAVQAALATRLLGLSPTQALEQRVGQLEYSRERSVDAAVAERRRIERDLHDGAQQRLIALAMDLGMAKEKLDTDPQAARSLVDEAHQEAKRAIVELRDLARGIHPAVLTDGGLDAALSALAAKAPVPVRVDVDVDPRPSQRIEGIAYFVVAEALTNVSRHAHATRASVALARRGDRLTVEVRDDGVGGADSARGTGLAGLADRVQSVDGRFDVISPPGGPTTVLVELPCGS
ncbi:MAG TPA: sensor domain-containing protein [Acidimicrobiales bacterium]|nr:sensor domain-containing protein [Acidimicrobiales bacterium]